MQSGGYGLCGRAFNVKGVGNDHGDGQENAFGAKGGYPHPGGRSCAMNSAQPTLPSSSYL